MSLTRRHILQSGLVLAIVPTGVSAADCDAIDLSRGIAFKRQDGTRGLARREGDGTVVIDYVTNKGDWVDRRRTRAGIYETGRILSASEFPVVGSAPPEWQWTYTGKPPEPEAGQGWSAKVKELRIDIGYGDYMKEIRTINRLSWKVSYSFLAPKEVKISGCPHSIIPVEAVFQGKGATRSQRWIYFPRFGFGIETRRDGKDNGITALTPA